MQRQLVIILLIVFIAFLGLSMPYPIFAPLFLHPSFGGIVPPTWTTLDRNMALGITLAIYPFGQFIGLPLLGTFSDRWGRKPVLLVSLVLTLMSYLFSAWALQTNHLILLIISRFLTGCAEGNIAIVYAMVADLKGISKQKGFGRVFGIGAIGYVIGPLLGGFFSDPKIVPWFQFSVPFYLAALITLITLIFASISLQETREKTSLPAHSIKQQLQIMQRFRRLLSQKKLRFLILTRFIFILGVDFFYEFGPVYLTGIWQMTSGQIAIYNAALSLGLAIGGYYLAHQLSNYFQLKKIVLIGIMSTMILFALMILIPTKVITFILFGLLGLTISQASSTLTVQVSDAAEPHIQGEVMGTLLGLRMLGDAIICIIGALSMTVFISLPLIFSMFISMLAFGYYYFKYYKVHTYRN